MLDFAPGAADVLASIADAVKGKVTIIADGGVRSGGDVLKLLALGADAVMIGRPVSVAAVGGLQDGVQAYLEKIRGELIQTMVLTGAASAGSGLPSVAIASRIAWNTEIPSINGGSPTAFER